MSSAVNSFKTLTMFIVTFKALALLDLDSIDALGCEAIKSIDIG